MRHEKMHATAHSKVSLKTPAETEFWCTYFGASAADLQAAIAANGSYLVSVQDYLESRKRDPVAE